MNEINRNAILKQYEDNNTLIVGLDSYKASSTLFESLILNDLYSTNNTKKNQLTILITDNTNLSHTIYAGCLTKGVRVEYFDLSEDFSILSPHNPLHGHEDYVIEKIKSILLTDANSSAQFTDTEIFFRQINECLITKSIKVIKRLKGDFANLKDVDVLLNNTGGEGRRMVMSLSKLQQCTLSMARENSDIAQWFLNDYYSGLSGERRATKTFEYSNDTRSRVSNLLSTSSTCTFLNPDISYPTYSNEDYVLINLKRIDDYLIKNFILNSILLDIFNNSEDKRKVVYSDIDLNFAKNGVFNSLIFNSKRTNSSFLLSTQEFHRGSDLLSGFTDTFLLSECLSIKDYEYFKQMEGYKGLKTLSFKNNNIYIDSDIFPCSLEIPYSEIILKMEKYQKDKFLAKEGYLFKSSEHEKDTYIDDLMEKILYTLSDWSCFEDFQSLSVYIALRNYLSSIDRAEALKCRNEVLSLCSRLHMPYIEDCIKNDNSCIYNASYCNLDKKRRLKIKEIKELRPIKIQLEYLNVMLILIEKFNLSSFSCEREVRELINKLLYKYYREICVDKSMTYKEIEEKIKLRDMEFKKGIYYTIYKIDSEENEDLDSSNIFIEDEDDCCLDIKYECDSLNFEMIANSETDSLDINISILDDDEDDDI